MFLLHTLRKVDIVAPNTQADLPSLLLLSPPPQLSREQASQFHWEEAAQPGYESLVSFMCSGPLVALVLTKPCAVSDWATLMGPQDPQQAREEAPKRYP
jgi:Nucleoside diphosphate kinase